MFEKELNDLLEGMNISLEDKNIYIWGTGNTSQLYIEGLKRITDRLLITGYCDSNEDKQGSIFNELKVYSPDEVFSDEKACILICSPQPNVYREISARCKGRLFYHIDYVIFSLYKDEVKKCMNLLGDEKSREVYFNMIKNRVNAMYPQENIISDNQYFPFLPFKGRYTDETFVDCGAFVGDSVERYIFERDGAFKRIFAFEPDEKNVQAMEYRVPRLIDEWAIEKGKILICKKGVSDNSEKASLVRNEVNNGLGSKFVKSGDNGTEICEIISLDDYIDDKVDFIKADIESYEYKMIVGARNIIKKYKPKLAICIYHNAIDFFQIPMLIKEICGDYILAVRHHGFDASETVLYAWVE